MPVSDEKIAKAYEICRKIARERAKNFYYSFVALPKAKRDAICAVYAFMRHADDLSDDESVPIAERRVRLEGRQEAWKSSLDDGANDDPVFVALGDAQRRFDIPTSLLEQLVAGTTMDLQRA